MIKLIKFDQADLTTSSGLIQSEPCHQIRSCMIRGPLINRLMRFDNPDHISSSLMKTFVHGTESFIIKYIGFTGNVNTFKVLFIFLNHSVRDKCLNYLIIFVWQIFTNNNTVSNKKSGML